MEFKIAEFEVTFWFMLFLIEKGYRLEKLTTSDPTLLQVYSTHQ
ncbi:hypothetical protein IPA_03245 [Ignicoccus pacificus DSM 13166]|uniref:Uncharacterized protein n=1 Tax=Ignicoccus pacificus DSM 13166 TaxID=940294 RepID=A0A977PLF6_9CREN|nr:hypothetical protein IPA_03245 [Ignicoccus pacificus DSM 13166]